MATAANLALSPNDYILLRNGQKKLVRSLQGGEHRLTKLGKGFFRDKYYEYLVHVRRRSGRNAGAQGLAAGERAGRRNEAPGPPHGGAGGARPGRPHPAALGRVMSRDGKVTSRGTLCTEPSSCNTNHVERCIRTMPL